MKAIHFFWLVFPHFNASNVAKFLNLCIHLFSLWLLYDDGRLLVSIDAFLNLLIPAEKGSRATYENFFLSFTVLALRGFS